MNIQYKKYLIVAIIIILLTTIAIFIYLNIVHKNPLQNNGINNDKMTIRYVDVYESWNDEYWPVTFSIKRAYLTPDIADVGYWRDNYSIGTKNAFLVIEVDATNNGISSNGRTMINAGGYLRLVNSDDDKEIAPASNSDLYLSSQEGGSQFIIFIVDKNLKETNLLIGLLAKPKVTHLNFFSADAKTYNGVFLFKTGLAESYNQ